MSNVYCDLSTFKDRLNIKGSGADVTLLVLLEHVSRAIDQASNRFFYIKTETRHYDGSAGPLLLDLDLISVSSLKTDDDESGDSWETTWTTNDYLLLPYNGLPKHAVSVTPWGSKSDFNQGLKKTLEVAGSWGYDQVTEDTGADVNETYAAGDTTLTVTDGAKVNVGQTVLIDSEQLCVTAISGNDLTVERGTNGTTDAAHSSGADISVYRYPRALVEACILQAARRWRRRDPAFSGAGDLPGANEGALPVLDPDVKSLLAPFRKITVNAV